MSCLLAGSSNRIAKLYRVAPKIPDERDLCQKQPLHWNGIEGESGSLANHGMLADFRGVFWIHLLLIQVVN